MGSVESSLSSTNELSEGMPNTVFQNSPYLSFVKHCVGLESYNLHAFRLRSLISERECQKGSSRFAQNNLSSKNTTKAMGFKTIDK